MFFCLNKGVFLCEIAQVITQLIFFEISNYSENNTKREI